MKTFTRVVVLAGWLGVSGAGVGESIPTELLASEVRMTGNVQEISHPRREMKMVSPDGRLVTLQVGPNVPRFDDVRAGDRVEVRYLEPVALAIHPASEPLPAAAAIQMTSDQGTQSRVPVLTTLEPAIVENIDLRRDSVLLNSRGVRTSVRVGADLKPQLEHLKPGDQVLAQYTQAVAFDMR